MVARWPGMIPAGEVCEAPCYFPDLFPTIAEMAGLPQPSMSGDVDGISILPTLLGEVQEGLSNRYLYWEDTRDEGSLRQAARYGDWKAIRLRRDGPTELYNLAEDESETDDVSADYPEIVGKFERFFTHAHEPSPHWPAW